MHNKKLFQKHIPVSNVSCIHFVGIGGIGMSGIAQVLLNLGFKVTGSDKQTSSVVKGLQKKGATIYFQHNKKNVKDADVVVVSSAIDRKNPEIQKAEQKNIPVVERAEMLSELMRFSFGIAISGTHGKTTTTSLIAQILSKTPLDPTYVIGGVLNNTGSNAYLGTGDYFIAEADESDASFLYLNPMVVVLTNIDADHLKTYDGSFSKLKETFLKFIHQVPFYGNVILCIDDENVKEIIPKITKPMITYGFCDDASYRITNLHYENYHSVFDIKKNGKNYIKNIRLSLPGRHNVQNATAAIVLADILQIKPDVIKKSLIEFVGIGRRFDTYNTKIKGQDITIINDYAHHPTEIKATIDAAIECYSEKRLVVVFQPHRYSRTYDLLDDFSKVLADVPILLVSEVYTAGESLIEGADGRALCANIRAYGKNLPIFIDDISNMQQHLEQIVKPYDVVLCVGAGNISTFVGKML
jgi:UDP-N-acetylmuramate--alanine ligase